MTRAVYSLAGFLLTPFLFFWLKRRAERGKEDAARFAERFGYAARPRPAGRLAWLHAASVGETQSVLTLVRALLARDGQLSLLITTGTVTSAHLVAQQSLPRTIHQYIPLDTPLPVRRFLNHWKPDLALWVESELWPQLLWGLRARRVPALLINARLSARSYARWKRFPALARDLLACFSAIYAGSGDDASRLRALGASPIEAGNLKYDAAPLPADDAALSTLQEDIGERPLWLAASTHANEEQMVADAHRALAPAHAGLLTIVVPRHPARGADIAADLRARGLTVARRSQGERIGAATNIYLADTMGELGTFYRLADIVFLGGSLIAHGGHNPLEPARLNCALLTGPHTHNFAAIVTDLGEAGGLRVAKDSAELATTVGALLAGDEARLAMAAKAAAVVASASGAAERIVQHAEKLLAETRA
ncbi:MAG: 3-deoxy-D-manno-octulosonic acid transferase [Alphaproteobacteria bacterium]